MRKLYSFIKGHIYLVLLIFLPIIFFSGIILNPNFIFFPPQDIMSIFSQEKMLFQDTVINFHTLPLWNPYIFSGSPFLGNPTPAMFYPINLLFLLFPVDLVFGYVFLIDTILIGVFTYLFAKSIRLDEFSSFISAVVAMFSGPLISLIFPGHLINLDTFIWFPLILFIYEKAITKQKLIYSILASFPIALTLLAGASQVAFFSLLSAFIYLLLRTVLNLPKNGKFLFLKRMFMIFFLSIIIGFLLAAVQIIPASEFSKLSARSNGLSYEFASDFSLHPKQLISFILPFFFGNPANGTYWGKGNYWGLNGYIGIFPLILAIATLIFKRKRIILPFLALGLFSLLFSLGDHTPLFRFFFDYVPGFNSFRSPARFLYYYVFSFALLAGIGMNFLIQKIFSVKKYSSKLLLISLPIAVAILVISILVLFSKNVKLYEKYILKDSYAVGINHSILYSQLTMDILTFSIILTISSILLLLIARNKINMLTFKIIIAALILLDLWNVHSKILSVKKRDEVYSTPNLIKTIKNDNGIFRIFDKTNSYLSPTERNKIENITGVHSLYIKDYRDFIWAIGKHEDTPYESFIQINKIEYPIFLNLLNVKYIIDDNGLTNNKRILPRAYIVPNAVVLPKQKILSKLKDKDFDPRKQVILRKNPGVSLTNFTSFKEVKIYYRNPNEIKLRTDLNNSGFLVLSEIYYPGWRAYDNGKELEIYNANYILRSIYLNKGDHDITFIYDPVSYKAGKTISLVTLFLCLTFLFYKRKRLLVDIKKLFI